MIQGCFGDEDELIFEIELIADNGLELPIYVILDTGFSDWLVMDEQVRLVGVAKVSNT